MVTRSFPMNFLVALFLVLIGSCGESVESYTAPDQTEVITEIVLELSEDETVTYFSIPDSKSFDLTISQVFNNGTEVTMTDEDVSAKISWELQTEDEISLVVDAETGEISLEGTGSGDLIAKYLPDTLSANKELQSNPLAITVVEPSITGISVSPAESYNIGCEFSSSPPSQLVEGCFMQFQATATYDNGDQADITDSVVWVSSDITKADVVGNVEIDNFAAKDWYSARTAYINENNLESRSGLFLGYGVGGFTVSASYPEKDVSSDISDTVSVITPGLYSLEAHISLPGGDVCADNCILYQNTSINLEANGTYTNGVVSEMIRQSVITSSAGANPDIEIMQLQNLVYTGVVKIHYDAPSNVKFTIAAEGKSKSINTTVLGEEIISVSQESPSEGFGQEVSRKSNTPIYFLFEAEYNNKDYPILDYSWRKENLHTVVFHNWEIADGGATVVDEGPYWIEDLGIYIKTSDAESGTTTLSAEFQKSPEDMIQTYDWDISISNESSIPTSLSINPSYEGSNGYEYEITAGVPTTFSVYATFDNLTSKPLESGSQIVWSSPDTCNIEIVNPQPVKCIDSSGVVDTYEEEIRIIAETINFTTDISTDILLITSPTNLKSVSIEPVNPTIYGKDSIQLTAVGHFENGRSHVLPHSCINWSINTGNEFGSITEEGLLTVVDVASLSSIEVAAESDPGCVITGRTITDKTGTSTLEINPLPSISISIDDDEVSESNSRTLTFAANPSLPYFDREIVIPFQVGGSATPLIDHSIKSGSAKIISPDIDTTMTLNLNATWDLLDENEETVFIQLLSEGLINGRLSENLNETEVEVTIYDHDSDIPPSIAILSPAGVSVNEGDTIEFEIELNGSSGRDIYVEFDVTGDVIQEDYTVKDTTSDSFVIPAGVDIYTLEIHLNIDGKRESDEQLQFDVSADHVSNSPQSASVTVQDIDTILIVGQVGTPECKINDSCSVDLPNPLVNADNSVIPYTLGLENNPSWLSIDSNEMKLYIESANAVGEYDDIYLCVQYSGEKNCTRFSVNIIP